MFFLNHFSTLTKSTPLFQLWQLVLHAGASVFPVEVVSPVDTTSTFSTPLLLHTDTPICWHFGTTVDWYTGSPLDTGDPSKLTRLTQDGRTETNLDLFAATPTVRLRQRHNVAFAALCSSDNGFWRQEWRHQS